MNPVRELAGKVAVVTGASRGIGASIATNLLKQHTKVIGVSRGEGALSAIEGAYPSLFTPYVMDLSDLGQIPSLFAFVEKKFGCLDILINNAGEGQAGAGSVINCSLERLDDLLAINVRALYVCCQQSLRAMIPRGTGSIINIASVAGMRGFADQGAYCASKHAVLGLTRAIIRETEGTGVCVTAILPGRVNTEMLRRSSGYQAHCRPLDPEDIAGAVSYVLSLPSHVAIDELVIRNRY